MPYDHNHKLPVLDIEKPEFVIFTGDVVVSNESFKGLDIVLDVCIKRNIPFAVVFGNHDDEYVRMVRVFFS